MKLENSEVLLLAQLLYYIKCTSSYLEASDQIDELHEKLNSFLLGVTKELTNKNFEEGCAWHSEQDICDEESNSVVEVVDLQKLLELECINVVFNEKNSDLKFESGLSKSMLDINLNDGEEILCDIVEIKRDANSFDVNCASGWASFDVQKFPKSWTSLLNIGIYYRVK